MNIKKVLSIFLALAIMLGTIPGMSFAVSAEDEPAAEPEAETVTITNQQTSGTMTVSLTVPARDPIPYLDADGTEKQTGPDCYDVYTTDTSLGFKSAEQWYVVLESMTLETTAALIILGDVKLVICDGATLTVPHGINLDNGSITVYAQSTDEQTMGKLIANAHDDSCAAIGSSASKTPGTITVNGGNINATGGENGAAIGGGSGSKNVNVTINGGVVTATGGANSAAISGNLTVNDGTVNATGSGNGAAISGSITVSGGTVTADAANGAAIDCDLTVSGGVVTATGGANSAAINGNITVDDGTVNVTVGGESAAINGNLTVEGGDVTVDSANSTAIGGELTVNGGVVTATGVPALSGNPTVADDMFAKAGDSEAAAVVTDLDQLDDKNYVLITPKYTVTSVPPIRCRW